MGSTKSRKYKDSDEQNVPIDVVKEKQLKFNIKIGVYVIVVV